jgi:hypothetical protein
MRESTPKDAAGRLRLERKRSGFKSARSAAIRFGWKPSTYGSHENGQTPVPQDSAAEYAKAFRTSVAWLLTGVNPGNDTVQVDGTVHKHGAVEWFLTKNSPWVWLPFGIIPGTIVLMVRDAGMSPRCEVGDIILVDENNPDVGAVTIPQIVGDEALVVTENGKALLRRLLPTRQPGFYDLEWTNCPSSKGVSVARANLVIATIKARQVEVMHPGKARAAKRTRR